MLYLKRLYTLFSAAAMVLLCFVPVCDGIYVASANTLSLWGLFGGYILLIPLITVLDALLDGLLFMRFKFNFVFGLLWCIILFYIYCRLAIYGLAPKNMSAAFYIAFLPGITVSALALTIRDCDNSGLCPIRKCDMIWLVFFAVLGILTVIRLVIMKNDPSSLYAFDDVIKKAAIG